MNNIVRPNTHQRSELNPCFEEWDQFHQDLQSPSLYSLYPDPCHTFCSYFGMTVSLVICIYVILWMSSGLFYNMVKVISLVNANRTSDISLANFTNYSLSLNESFY